MRVLVTGADGFIGRNLAVRLAEVGIDVVPVVRSTPEAELAGRIDGIDAVCHLAGVNRTDDPADFNAGNRDFTDRLCTVLEAAGRAVPILYTSSIQAERDNDYGRSKLGAEERLERHAAATGSPVAIFRLPNVFGKWSRPNYNSAVATFCHNLSRGLPIAIHDPAAMVRLVHVDDVIDAFIAWLKAPAPGVSRPVVAPEYAVSVGELAATIASFRDIPATHTVADVGVGLTRALYATYVSFLEPEGFCYPLVRHEDPRGVFVEFLKTEASGQFSYFTAWPGVTRGGHYHHSKTEKFLVLKGEAEFRFRNLATDEFYALKTSGASPVVVQTVPGWTHDITNVGTDEMVVMLWANEIFDRERPDTVMREVAR